MPREAPVTSAIRSKRGGGISRYPGRAKRAADSLEPISKSFEEDDEAGKLDKAEEIVGVVLPANEDPALPLNLTFCAIFARLYPSPIYSPENTLWFVGASLLVGLIGGGFLPLRPYGSGRRPI